MRPDVIDWTRTKACAGTTFLPRQRLHRICLRWMLSLLAVQLIAMMVILVLLQGPWREERPDHAQTLVNLAVDRVNEAGRSRNIALLPQTMLELTEEESIAFAVIVDETGREVYRAGDSGSWLQTHAASSGRALGNASGPGLVEVDARENLAIFQAPLNNAQQGDRLVVGLHDVGARRAVIDGAVAALGAFILVTFIGAPLVWWRLRRWSAGLRGLHAAIGRLARGAEPMPVAIGSEGEIAYVQTAFNDMAGKLLASRRDLMNANEDLERRVAQRTDELRAANDELAGKNQELAELTETALRFTDDVAHEFRTPLAVIMEFASLTIDGIAGEVNQRQEEFLQFIVNASHDLSQLVDDFLDSGKLRARNLRVDRRRHSIEEIFDSTWPLIESRAAGRRISVERAIEPDVPDVCADIEKVRRIIVNLTTNAIKFSQSESTIRLAAETTKSGRVRISVADQGPGLTAAEVETLFERFRQTSSGRRSSAKGFGLGLNIVSDLVAVNLGEVNVESTPGEGSVFSFTLPPADPEELLNVYLEHVADRSPDTSLAVLQITRNGADLDELQSFIAGTVRPSDVQFPLASGGGVVVIGETSDAQAWIEHLHSAEESERELTQETPSAPLEIEHLGTWSLSSERGAICTCVMNTLTREVQFR